MQEQSKLSSKGYEKLIRWKKKLNIFFPLILTETFKGEASELEMMTGNMSCCLGVLSDWNLKTSIIILLWFLFTKSFGIHHQHDWFICSINTEWISISCHTFWQPSGPSDKGSGPWGFRCLGTDTTRCGKNNATHCNCVQVNNGVM